MEGIVFPSAIAVGFDGVFVGAPPNLLFVPDRDGDDKADMADIEVRLTGWGIRDRHEVVNSLHWGPDGWLYGLQGLFTSSKIRKPAGKGRLFKPGEPFPEDILEGDGVEINGGVWRYHPTKDRFEVVAHGFSNPWGIDYDAKGQLLISACVIPHLWHVIPGGVYQRQGGQHFNPYVYGDIQTIADHRHRSAHGGARVYQSDAFPDSQQGRLFMANIHEHAVLSDVLTRKGSGFTARHGEDFLLANNAQWVGFSIEIGPEGALYVLDWHDADICGADVLNHETGRIFRIMPKQSAAEQWPGRYTDLRTMPDRELVALQTSKSDWHARRARVILQSRAAKGALGAQTHDELMQMFRTSANADWRLRAMWALHVTGGWTPDGLLSTLADSDEYIRAWAVQLLTEDRTPAPKAVETFARMAREDRSAGRAPVPRVGPAAPGSAGPLERGRRAADPRRRRRRRKPAEDHLVWRRTARRRRIQPSPSTGPATAESRWSRSSSRAEQWTRTRSSRSSLPSARTHGCRRVCSRGSGTDSKDGSISLHRRTGPRQSPGLKRSPDTRITRLAAEVTEQFGDAEAAGRNLTAVRTRTVAVDDRRRALRTLAAQRRPELVPELATALDEAPLRVEAIRAIAAYDDEGLGKLLIAQFQTFNSTEKYEAVQTLASRGRYGRMLTEALASGGISKTDVPPNVARQLRRVVGVRFAEVWGPVEQTAQSATEERAYARYRGLLNEATLSSANAANGRALFQRTCGACHKMYGEGGVIGPDITGSNRANLEYLLSNVLTPNAEVQDAYKMVVVTTRDGRTHSGNVVSETDRQLTLRVVGRDPVVLSKADIQSRETTAASLMPPGLFDTLTDREVADLVAYLRTVEQVKAP